MIASGYAHEDWSDLAVHLVERGDYRDAEVVARTEFETSRDEQVFRSASAASILAKLDSLPVASV
jgi:hypothetical protein